MYTGTTTTKKNFLRTGLHALRFKGVNLTQEQIKERFGIELVKEPDYQMKTDNFGNDIVRSVIYLAGENNEMYRLNISIGNTPAKAKSGNYEVITSTGAIVWAGKKVEDSVVIKDEFENHRPLNIGEGDWFTFVQRLVGFDSRSGANFFEEMSSFNQTSDDIFKDKLSAINDSDLIDKTIIVLLAVRNVEDKNYQEVVTNRRTWFSGNEVTTWHLNKIQELQEKEISNGNTLCKNLFTYQPSDFDKSKCFNNVPTTPTSSGVSSSNAWN